MNEMILKLANELASKGIVLKVKDDSILRTVGDLENPAVLNSLATKFSYMLNGEVDIVKNRVIPFIREFKDNLKELLPKNTATAGDEIEIKEFFIPDNIKMMVNTGLINTNREPINPDLKISKLKIEVKDINSVKKLLKIERPEVDEYVNEITDNITEIELEELWHSIFDNVSASNPEINKLNLSNVKDSIKIFALFLITYNILKGSDLISYNTSNGELMNQINSLHEKLYTKVVYFINLAKRYTDSKMVIVGRNKDEIIVFRDMYLEYLQEGNEIEVILGAYLSDVEFANKEQLNLNKDKYLEKWNQFVHAFNVNKKLKDINGYKLAYKITFLDMLNNYKDVDTIKEIIDLEIYENSERKIMEYINGLTIDRLYEIVKTSEDICLNLLFKYTNAPEFIEYMREYKKMDETITPKQAASFAVLNLTVDFLMNQFTTEAKI